MNSRNLRLPLELSRRRHGVALLEATIAAAMLAVLLASAAQLLRVLAIQQRSDERHAVAVQSVQAITEQIGNMKWEDLTTEKLDGLKLPEMAATKLPGARLKMTSSDEDLPLAAKRVAVELTWEAANGRPARPVRLTTWIFPEDEVR